LVGGSVAAAVPEPDAGTGTGEAYERALVDAAMVATVGELATGVAHELSNPLFAILGLAELLLAEAEPGTQAHRRLEMIRDSGGEIREILRAVSDFAHDRDDELQIVALDQVIRSAIELVRRTSTANDVEFVERFLAGPVLVEGSPTRLKQVFVSLIANAQQAMAGRGTVTIEVARTGRWATASVADTGPGIAPHILPQVFEPFFTTRKGKGGTGLGLAAGRAVAREHAGELSAESLESGGARFTLRLPASKGSA
jgi:signal transduction histidine kinase